MRLDKFLKVSHLVKRREVAHDFINLGKVLVSGKTAKPSTIVKKGDIVDYGKKACNLNTSFVYVLKKGDDYQYILHLDCPAKKIYRDDEVLKENSSLTNSSSFSGSNLSFNFSSNSIKLAGYQFTLFDAAGNIIYNSDGASISGISYNDSISLEPYMDRGIKKIVVTVYDEYGNYNTVSLGWPKFFSLFLIIFAL